MKNGSGSIHEEEGEPHERKDNYRASRNTRSDSKFQRHHYSPTHALRKFYAFNESRRSPEVSLVRHQRRIYELDSL
jgi:hypothetical protein